MKNLLLALIILVATSGSTYATIPTDHPKLSEYFSKRYVEFVYAGAHYRVDFNQVQSVVQDTHGHMKYVIGLENTSFAAGSDKYYLMFKNNSWLYFNSTVTAPNPMTAFGEYSNFLRDNPQFLSIP